MSAVAGFTEERNFEKRACAETAATGAGRSWFPTCLRRSHRNAAAPFDIHRDVLPLPGSLPPEGRPAPRSSQPSQSRHRAETKLAGENRILSVERERAPAVLGCESNVSEHFIGGGLEIKLRGLCGMAQLGFDRFCETIVTASVGPISD